MSIALYRKYRPKIFAEVSNQNHIKLTLQNELKNDRLGHAYLLCGPRGTGKTTLARLLAKAVNCENLQEHGEPCNECNFCRNFIEGKMMDVVEIDAASHTGVDNVRENIINNARFTPSSGKYKIFIIDEVHMLSISAFNALLKLLEEPPKYVIFILATTEVHKVPITIISRCQRFDFKRVPFRDLVERLRWITEREGANVDKEVLELIARHAEGCVRDAESLLEQVLSLGEKKISLEEASLILPRSNFEELFDLLECFVKKDARKAVELINRLMEDGLDIYQFMDQFIELARRGLVYKLQNSIDDLSQDMTETKITQLIELLDSVEPEFLVKIIRVLLRAKEEMRYTQIAQLPMEMAIVDVIGSVSVKSAPQRVISEKKAETLVEPEPQPAPTQAPMSDILVGMQNRWAEFLQHIQKDNYALKMTLSVGYPIELQNQELMIGFLYALQKEKFEEPETKSFVQAKIKEFFDHDLQLNCIVDASLDLPNMEKVVIKTAEEKQQDAVDSVLDEFGGEVV